MKQPVWNKTMLVASLLLLPVGGHAQQGALLPEEGAQAETADDTAARAGEEAASAPVPENSVAACQDGADNDADQHIDCDDQDCEIFAVCVKKPEANTAPPPTLVPLPERGGQCRDGRDNDHNGQADCHDISCQYSRYCKQVMYERPEPRNKAPGFLFSFGLGVALPNYRTPTAETDDVPGQPGIPFDPDMGLMVDLQVGYMFLKFLGAGLNFKSAFTFGTNRDVYFLETDDPKSYKYTGSKYYGNLGGFMRLQWPFSHIVPYLNIHVGYSVSRYKWHVYDAANQWNDIYDFEADNSALIYGDRYESDIERSRHFTFALEPGFDLLAVKRLFGVGIRAWLPVVASAHASRDNIGIILNLTFTPMWRESMRLKSEYQPKSK